MKRIFYSQQAEDFFIFLNLINLPRFDGIVVEVGALDGVRYSNSKFFEEFLSFRCVLIEPSKTSFERLRANRPGALCFECVAGGENGETMFLGQDAIAGVPSTLPQRYQQALSQQGFEAQRVQQRTLDSILLEAGVGFIDILSIDVEGGELSVLQGLNRNFLRERVSLVVIELDGHNAQKDRLCQRVLQACGFTRLLRIGLNEFYLNQGLKFRGIFYDPELFGSDAKLKETVRQWSFAFIEPGGAQEMINDAIRFYKSSV